jgi:hypothetical protein
MKTLLLTCQLLSLGVLLQAQSQFEARVSLDSVLLGNQLEVTFLLSGEKGRNFSPPTFDGFEVLAGPNVSSMTQIVNGSFSQEKRFIYYLKPQDVGIYFIEPAVIYVDGEPLETQPIEVLVVPNPDGIIQQPANPMQVNPFGGSDFFNFDNFFSPFPSPTPKQDPPAPGEDVHPDSTRKKRPTVRL